MITPISPAAGFLMMGLLQAVFEQERAGLLAAVGSHLYLEYYQLGVFGSIGLLLASDSLNCSAEKHNVNL